MILRRDAARNRDKLIEAAQAVFAEQGLDVPLEAVADRACVGIATLYRRFPTRDALIAAAFEDRMAEYARVAEEALDDRDPWTGFTGFVEHICEMQAADRGVGDVFTRTLPAARGLEEERERGYAYVVRLIERAKLAGRLRTDFTAEDLPLLLMANAGVVEATGEAAPIASRRFVALMLEALRADGASVIAPPIDPRDMYKALRRAGRRRRATPSA
ncbi:MAG: TetR/AcrR family transcriptional regulator [Chloroflexota bacterium]|nr:TetR/AcrR family transcriptional regulator [Chloroflexota bacterium]